MQNLRMTQRLKIERLPLKNKNSQRQMQKSDFHKPKENMKNLALLLR